MTVATATAIEMCVWQVDFVSVYLNSRLEHRVHMHLHKVIYYKGAGLALLLLKTMCVCGLMHVGYNWWHALDTAYQKFKYIASH